MPTPNATPAAISFSPLALTCVECSGFGRLVHCGCRGVCSHDDSECGSCGGEGTALSYCGVCDATIGERGLTGYAVLATRDDGESCPCVVCSSAECVAEVVRDQREWAGDVPVLGLAGSATQLTAAESEAA